jgi:3-mercaptopyruvate sulfurtransferase SseA
VAFRLKQVGFTRIRPLLGGLDAWIEAGLPVEGDEPTVLSRRLGLQAGENRGAGESGTPPPAA